ncbi:MAG: hypothetical protein L0287_28445, partial [Anaerolineae bacterium]|nr:hypothetical protein [Anaerolineae bacterium]
MTKSSVMQLSKRHLQQMIEHATNDAENEVCGLIGGHWRPFDRIALAVRVEGVANAAYDRSKRYRMDERE